MSNLTTKVANWLPRPGKAKVTYAEGSSFEGVFNGERIKEGSGKYTWMKPAEEDGEDPQVLLQTTYICTRGSSTRDSPPLCRGCCVTGCAVAVLVAIGYVLGGRHGVSDPKVYATWSLQPCRPQVSQKVRSGDVASTNSSAAQVTYILT